MQLHTILAIVVGLGGYRYVPPHIGLWNDKNLYPPLASGLYHSYICRRIHISTSLPR